MATKKSFTTTLYKWVQGQTEQQPEMELRNWITKNLLNEKEIKELHHQKSYGNLIWKHIEHKHTHTHRA